MYLNDLDRTFKYVTKPCIPFILLALLSTFFSFNRVFAQQKKEKENVLLHPDKFYRKYMPGFKIKRNPPDSVYIKTYPNFLSVGMHVLSPAIRLRVRPRAGGPEGFDPSSSFRTNISDVLGFSASYRFISAGFAFLLNTGMNMHSGYARSHYRTATIKYSSTARSFQFKYIRIRGFTDVHQAGSADGRERYVRRPDMVSKEFQFEGLHNFSWRRYSYIAPITFAQRQVKSHSGFLLKGGIYYNQISGDSALLSYRQRTYYNDFADAKVLRTLSLRIAPGFGCNIVFLKRLYFSLATFTSADLYFYKYLQNPDEKRAAHERFIFVLDSKAGLGYHSKRLYAGIRFDLEKRIGSLQDLAINNTYQYTGIELGYRFDAPGIVKKVYKKTMPPGM